MQLFLYLSYIIDLRFYNIKWVCKLIMWNGKKIASSLSNLPQGNLQNKNKRQTYIRLNAIDTAEQKLSNNSKIISRSVIKFVKPDKLSIALNKQCPKIETNHKDYQNIHKQFQFYYIRSEICAQLFFVCPSETKIRYSIYVFVG